MTALTSKDLKVGAEYRGKYHSTTTREVVSIIAGTLVYLERVGEQDPVQGVCLVWQFLLWAGDE